MGQPNEEGRHKPLGRIYLAELSAILDRRPHTIHRWEMDGDLPRSCRPYRDSRNWRYWTPAQVDELERWIESRLRQSETKLEKLRAIRDRGVIKTTTTGEE